MIVHTTPRKSSDKRRVINPTAYSPLTVRSLLPQVIHLECGLAVHHLTPKYFYFVDKWVRAEGKLSAVKRLKNIYISALRSLANDPVEFPWIKTNKRGFPRSFEFLERFYRSQGQTPQAMQAVLSILGYYRNILAPGIPDLGPITEPGPEIPSALLDEILTLGFNPEWKIKPKQADPVKLELRSKVGPNGQATVCAVQDLAVLPDNLVDSLLKILSKSDDEDFIKGMIPRLRKGASSTKGYHSRLAIKREKGGKDRVFAMVDYWTQIVLKPLHRKLGQLLETISNDCTYNQSKGNDLLKQWTLQGVAESIDLSNATDRFPMQLQVAVMEKLTDSDFAQAWCDLMVNREFTYKGKPYKWSVGQPLGAHSSWPSFALSHHIVMRAAYQKAGIDPKDQYILLGDDMAAKSSEALLHYRNYLQQLGVAISPTKGLNGNSCEFAKRVFNRGYEVSPVPVPMLQTMLRDKFLLPEFIAKVRERSSDSQSDLRVSAFLDHLIKFTKWDREIVSILSQYPLPQMRYILNHDGPSVEGNHPNVVWNGIEISIRSLWEVFQEVKYYHLLRQLDELTKSARSKLAEINKLELPATPAGIRRQHPLFFAYGNYFDEVDLARKEVRGYMSARDWTVEVPSVHLTNVTALLKGSQRGARHSGKLLLETWSDLRKLQDKERSQS